MDYWAQDPTVDGMLNMLDAIHEKCKGITDYPNLSKVKFYFFDLESNGLNENLYLKMNSRGKKLTEFEIFKSDLEKAIKRISPDLKDEISIKIDNTWMDIMWTYAQSSNDDSNIVKKADEGFMQMFKNIFRLELFRRKIEIIIFKIINFIK